MGPSLNDLLNLLLQPGSTCTFDDLPRHWRQSTLQILCERPHLFEEGPWVPAAVRGAWGRQLLKQKTDGTAVPAVQVFFSALGQIVARRSVPPPFAFGVSYEGNAIIVELTLFGIADAWRQEAFDALIAAVADGIAVVPGRKGFRHPWVVHDAGWTRQESISVPRAPTSYARLLFHTPVRLGPRRALGSRWPDLVVSLAERAARFARWQGVRVDPDLGAWRQLAERTKFVDAGMLPCVWHRRSGGQGGRRIPMAGLIGTLDIIMPHEALMPLLALGTTMRVGGHTALGLGRYELFC